MYPMLGTHLDLAYAIRALGRHAANPGEEHKHTLDWVFQYFQATSVKKNLSYSYLFPSYPQNKRNKM